MGYSQAVSESDRTERLTHTTQAQRSTPRTVGIPSPCSFHDAAWLPSQQHYTLSILRQARPPFSVA